MVWRGIICEVREPLESRVRHSYLRKGCETVIPRLPYLTVILCLVRLFGVPGQVKGRGCYIHVSSASMPHVTMKRDGPRRLLRGKAAGLWDGITEAGWLVVMDVAQEPDLR